MMCLFLSVQRLSAQLWNILNTTHCIAPLELTKMVIFKIFSHNYK